MLRMRTWRLVFRWHAHPLHKGHVQRGERISDGVDRGAFKIESETVTASLRQLRETLSPYCDVNGCVVPESADESSGFGGIISPPWWDDFQEP